MQLSIHKVMKAFVVIMIFSIAAQANAGENEDKINHFFSDVIKCRQSGYHLAYAPITSATGTIYILPSSARLFSIYSNDLRASLRKIKDQPNNATQAVYIPILIKMQDQSDNVQIKSLGNGLIAVIFPLHIKE